MATIIPYKGASIMDPDPSALNEGAKMIQDDMKLFADRTSGTAGRIQYFGSDTFPKSDPLLSFDDVKKVITMYRASGLDHIADVTSPEFGTAPFDGTVDNSAQFQAAVNSLINTGGTVFVPPGIVCMIGATVNIKSKYPIWISSYMDGSVATGVGGQTFADKSTIKPRTGLSGYMFVWSYPVGGSYAGAGGGGIEHVNFIDYYNPGDTARTVACEGVVDVQNATRFSIHQCQFQWINGRAFRVGTCVYFHAHNVKVYSCGAAAKPAVDVDGGGSSGFVWWDRGFIENNQYGNSNTIRVNIGCLLYGLGLYFEQSVSSGWNPGVDSTDGGAVYLYGPHFQNTQGACIVANGHLEVYNARFNCFTQAGGTAVLWLKAGAIRSILSGLYFDCATNSAPLIKCQAPWCTFSNIGSHGACFATPWIDFSGASRCMINGLFMYCNAGTAGQYIVELGDNDLRNFNIDGTTAVGGVPVCPSHGIRTSSGAVSDGKCYNLLNANAFTATGSAAQFSDLSAYNLGTGLTYSCFAGMRISNCIGSVALGTSVADNAFQSTITQNNAAEGVVTTPSLTLAPTNGYRLVLNNNLIIADSRVHVTLSRGSDTGSMRYRVTEVFCYSGVCEISLESVGAGNMNGTMKIKYQISNT